MSKWKDTMKGGWHPEKNSAHPDSRTGLGIRSRANGMIPGRGKQEDSGASHESTPLSALKDPSTFAPPPKRTGTGLAPAPPVQTAKRSVIEAPSKYHDPRSGPVQPAPKISSERELQQIEAAPQRPTSTGPYRANTTGLSTDNLPKPPTRRDAPALPSPPSYDSATASPGAGGRPVPSLPPRLPARTNTGGSAGSQAANQGGTVNRSAADRLGAAGVSVPGLGIGQQSTPSPTPPPRSNAPPAQVNSLQNRFAKLGTASSTTATTAAPPPAQGTTWQEKQAALKTASSFHKDPSSVSLSDAKAAAGTANNFRQRHGEQVSAGMQRAGQLNQQYGVADRLGRAAGTQQAPQQEAAASVPPQTSGVAGKKKPPPPPPKKKKPALLEALPGAGQAQDDDAPPPIPMSTRPTF